MTFGRDITSLADVIKETGNPFAENSKDLLVLDSRNLADPAVIDTLREIKSLGQEQYDTYVNERLVNQTKPMGFHKSTLVARGAYTLRPRLSASSD